MTTMTIQGYPVCNRCSGQMLTVDDEVVCVQCGNRTYIDVPAPSPALATTILRSATTFRTRYVGARVEYKDIVCTVWMDNISKDVTREKTNLKPAAHCPISNCDQRARWAERLRAPRRSLARREASDAQSMKCDSGHIFYLEINSEGDILGWRDVPTKFTGQHQQKKLQPANNSYDYVATKQKKIFKGGV